MDIITKQIIRIVSTDLDISESAGKITPETHLMGKGLALDSISIVDLIVNVETTFNLELTEDDLDMDNFTTVNSLAELVKSKQLIAA